MCLFPFLALGFAVRFIPWFTKHTALRAVCRGGGYVSGVSVLHFHVYTPCLETANHALEPTPLARSVPPRGQSVLRRGSAWGRSAIDAGER